MISPNRTVSTIAGQSAAGSVNNFGTAASFNRPTAVAFFPGSNVLFVSDSDNYRIRCINLNTLEVTTPSFCPWQSSWGKPLSIAVSRVAMDQKPSVFVVEEGVKTYVRFCRPTGQGNLAVSSMTDMNMVAVSVDNVDSLNSLLVIASNARLFRFTFNITGQFPHLLNCFQ